MNRAGNYVLNDYVQALGEIQKQEEEYAQKEAKWQAKFERVVSDLKALKSGEKLLEDLMVTDDGYEFIPREPEENNGSYSNGHGIPAGIG